MSHAEAVHTLQPAAGATDQIVQFTASVRYDALPDDARHYTRRHLLDTVGVMIAGAGGDVATRADEAARGLTDLERATRELEEVAAMLRELTRGFASIA